MRELLIKLALPLSVLSFCIVTKWWYALAVDAADTMYYGFPFPFICNGWHTSMSWQIFFLEMTADFLTYLTFWWLLLFLIDRYLIKFKAPKLFSYGLWSFAVLAFCTLTYLVVGSNNIYYFTRPYEIKTLETGYRFIWQPLEQPDFKKYKPVIL